MNSLFSTLFLQQFMLSSIFFLRICKLIQTYTRIFFSLIKLKELGQDCKLEIIYAKAGCQKSLTRLLYDLFILGKRIKKVRWICTLTPRNSSSIWGLEAISDELAEAFDETLTRTDRLGLTDGEQWLNVKGEKEKRELVAVAAMVFFNLLYIGNLFV